MLSDKLNYALTFIIEVKMELFYFIFLHTRAFLRMVILYKL